MGSGAIAQTKQNKKRERHYTDEAQELFNQLKLLMNMPRLQILKEDPAKGPQPTKLWAVTEKVSKSSSSQHALQ